MNPIRRALAGCGLSLGLFAAPSLAADPATPPATASDVALQIVRLADRDFRVRESATRELIRFDREARSIVWFLASSPDADLSERASRILKGIDRNRLVREFAVAPTLRLRFADVPLQVALADVERRTGIRLQEFPGDIADRTRRVTLDTGDVPFWDAIARFLDGCGLSVRPCTGIAPPSESPPHSGPTTGPDSTALPAPFPGPLADRLPPLPGLASLGFAPDPTAGWLVNATLRVGDEVEGRASVATERPVSVRAVAARHPGSRRSVDGILSLPLEVLRCGTLATSDIEEIHIDRAVNERGESLARHSPPVEEPDESQPVPFPAINAPPLGIPVSRTAVHRVADNPLMSIHLEDSRSASRRLARLEGSVMVRVSSVQSILEIPLDAGTTAARTLGHGNNRSIELVEVIRIDADTIRVEVRSVELEAAPPRRGLPVGSSSNGVSGLRRSSDTGEPELPVAFRDARDRSVEPLNEYRRDGIEDGRAFRSYRFEFSTKPGEIRLHLRGSVSATIAIPFSLRDVELP